MCARSMTRATQWGESIVLDAQLAGLFCSLRLVNGAPAVSYRAASNSELRYLRASDPYGIAWHPFVLLDAGGVANGRTTLLVGSDGKTRRGLYRRRCRQTALC